MSTRKASNAPLTPEQVETIARVWVETCNASEAARAAGCDEGSARKYIRQQRLPKASDLYAQALERGMWNSLNAVGKARRKVVDALDFAEEPQHIAALSSQLHDNLRTLASTMTAHAKLSGVLVERLDVTSGGKALAKMTDAELLAYIASLTPAVAE